MKLKAKIVSFVVALLLPAFAVAQQDSSNAVNLTGLGMSPELARYLVANGIVMRNNTFVKFANATPAATALSSIKLDATNNLFLNALSGKVGKLAVALTPVANWDQYGMLAEIGRGYNLQPYVPTLAATPVATTGANEFKPGLNVVPTAAANTAGFLGPKTPVPGQIFVIHNPMANTVRIKANGGATMNGATAGGFLELATLQTAFCQTTAATNQNCNIPAVPTAQ